MTPVTCVSVGTVIDSHLSHPRIPKAATHSITILPFKGEWPHTVATFGMAFKETVLSHYIYEGGVTFQGTWGTPST